MEPIIVLTIEKKTVAGTYLIQALISRGKNLKFTQMKLFSNCVSRIKRPAHFQQSMKSVLEVVLLT